MAYTVPRVTIAQEFTSAPTSGDQPLAALIVGPHFKLFRYAEAAEKATTKAINSDGVSGNNYLNSNTLSTDPVYYSASDVTYTYPNRPASSLVDTSYVNVYLENVEATYFPNSTLGSADGTQNKAVVIGVGNSTTVFYKNRIQSEVASFRLKTTAAGVRDASLSNRDVAIGDIIEVWDTDLSSGVGCAATPFKSKVKSLIAATTLAANGTPTSNLGVRAVAITTAGSGYTTAPAVTLGAPDIAGGIQATATSVISSGVTGITNTTAGTGYGAAPTVAISAPNLPWGVQATATVAVSGGNLTTYSITNAGSGYTSAPTVTLTPTSGGTGAVGTAVIALAVTDVYITNPGSGYTSNPTVTFAPPGSGTTAVGSAIVTGIGSVAQINVTNGGSGYTTIPKVAFSGGGFSTAAKAVANISSAGVVTSVTITNAGAGYTSAPTVSFSGGGGTGAATFNNTASIGTAPIPKITSAPSDFVGTSNITYKVTVVRGGLYYDGSTNADTCARVQVTSNGTDSSAALINVQKNTAFALGTLGGQAKFATTLADNVTDALADGLFLGNTFYVPFTAAGAGNVNIIELNDDLPSTILIHANQDLNADTDLDPTTSPTTTGLRFRLKLPQASVKIPQLRSLIGSQVNFTPGADTLILKADLTTTDPSLVSSGALVHLPITAGNVFIEYRALLQSTAASIASISDASLVATVLGVVHPDNVLAQGVYDALLNSAGVIVYYVGLNTNDLAGYNTALSLAKNTDKVYGLVPLTFDTTVRQAFVGHVDAMSAKTVGKERTTWLSAPLVPTALVYNLQVGGTDWVGTIVDDPLDSSSRATLVSVAGATFITDGVRVGDSLLVNFQLDATGAVVYDTFNIQEIRTQTSLVITTGYVTPITSAIKVQVRRNYTKSEQIANLAADGSGYNNRRVVSVFPDTYKNGTIAKNGYFMAASLAGLRSGVVPHQPLTNIEVLGATDVSKTFVDFTSDDLDTLAGAGYWIVTQDAIGSVPYTRHQLTTDSSDLNMQENSITSNSDSIAKGLRKQLSPYIGKYNINPTNILLFRSVIEGELRYRKTGTFTVRAGNQLIDYQIVSLAQSTTFKDKVEVVINLTEPYPNNNTDITLVI